VSPNDPKIRSMTTRLESIFHGSFASLDDGAMGALAFSRAMGDASEVSEAFKLYSKAQYEAAKKVVGEIR
jgi:hypothetical protein